eukprot:Gb_13989 [translate_table: standard]
MKSLEDLFKDYGVRLTTIVKIMEMGFTVSTLVNMTEQEVEDLVREMVETYHLDLLMGEKYGIRAAVRAEKRRIDEEVERQRLQVISKSNRRRKLEESSVLTSAEGTVKEQRREDVSILADAVASAGLLNLNSKDSIMFDQNHTHYGVSGLLALPEPSSDTEGRKPDKKKRRLSRESTEDGDDRPREHPFIVTEPGELARGKKNGLDYLFDLYEQCGKFLEEVQQISRERGEKCPTKVSGSYFARRSSLDITPTTSLSSLWTSIFCSTEPFWG